MKLSLACREDNDLYRALAHGKPEAKEADRSYCRRYSSHEEAIHQAPDHSGVLLLADDYPFATSEIDATLLHRAEKKKLRLYLEYAAALPGLTVRLPQRIELERVVVTSEFFAPDLERSRILEIHGCRFMPVEAGDVHIALARVAGFDKAAYGLPNCNYPALFEYRPGQVMVATTKLSHFVTGRYGPTEAWRALWRRLLAWLTSKAESPELAFAPAVAPSYGPDVPLPESAEPVAMRRCADWYLHSKMLIHPIWGDHYAHRFRKYHTLAERPREDWPAGDGSRGILEGFHSRIDWDGSQPVSYELRADCCTESAMALAFAGAAERREDCLVIARNLLDFALVDSELARGARADPDSGSYGLIKWAFSKDSHGEGVYYGDDNARIILAA